MRTRCCVGIDMSVRSPGLSVYCECTAAPTLHLYFLCMRKRDRGRNHVSMIQLPHRVLCSIGHLPYVPVPSEAKGGIVHTTRLCQSIREVLTQGCTGARTIYIEDYAYGMHDSRATSSLCELGGVLKYVLQDMGPVVLVAPSRLKKIFTGDGRATKQDMYRAFRARGYPDLYRVFGMGDTATGVPAPISDLVDATALIADAITNKIIS